MRFLNRSGLSVRRAWSRAQIPSGLTARTWEVTVPPFLQAFAFKGHKLRSDVFEGWLRLGLDGKGNAFKPAQEGVPAVAECVEHPSDCSGSGHCGGSGLTPGAAGSTFSLAHWVKESGVATAASVDSIPGLGTSVCHGCGHKK